MSKNYIITQNTVFQSNKKQFFWLLTRLPSLDQKAQSLLRGTPLTQPLSTLLNRDLSDSVGIDRSGWEGMLLYKVFSGCGTRVTVGRKIQDTQLERAGPWADNVALIWMTRSAHQPFKPAWGGWTGRERRKKGESKRNKEGEGEGRQGCPSFKHAGLNGTDSSDI